MEEIQDTHATESVDIGEERILHITSNSAWILFREGDIVAEVRYSHGVGIDREEKVKEYAGLMLENFPNKYRPIQNCDRR